MTSQKGPSRVRLHNIEVPFTPEGAQTPEHDAQIIAKAIAKRYGVRPADVGGITLVRRALDARQRNPRYNLSVDVSLPAGAAAKLLRQGKAVVIPSLAAMRLVCKKPPDGPRPVVVGAGPAGLFAAWTLAEAGWPPILIERGRPVETRARDVSKLYARGELNTESNVCFGEGGAGTFSDGKLYTRVGDARVDDVMRRLVDIGAPDDILVDNRPHLGTDRLVALLRSLRARLTQMGVSWRFETAVEDIVLKGGAMAHLTLAGGETLDARHVVLATGHSARNIWESLDRLGLPLEARPFAVGFRVEHPQGLIDAARYGRVKDSCVTLPAADYRLTFDASGEGHKRGVWSFCMCPGGVVVTTPTEPEALCINGMSHASRRGRYANSALVVSVGPEDFAPYHEHGVFAGVAFQEAAERAAYAAGGGSFVAPAARVTDFVGQTRGAPLGQTSYRRGLWPADLHSLYPAAIGQALKKALGRFGQQIPGFVSEEATLIGVETRTASPIRLPRGDDLQATGAKGLFPAGEGLGYGGGIVSAAVDGMRAAQAALTSVGAEPQSGV